MARFEWDAGKEQANQDKHGISFAEAQFAFADTNRVIARDLDHSQAEERFYCFGKLKTTCSRSGLPTATTSSALSAPGTGARARQFMSNRIKYTNEPIGAVEIVADFLPSPEDLAFREEGVKITLALSKKSVDFFRSEAARHHTQYQRMIRRLLDAYVESREALTSGASRPARVRRARS